MGFASLYPSYKIYRLRRSDWLSSDCPPQPQSPERTDDALRHEDDDEHEQDAVDGVGGADEVGAEPDPQAFGEREREQRADARTQHRIDPARDRREHDLQRHRDARDRLRVEIHEILAVDRATQRGQRRTDHGDAYLLAHHVDADGGSRILVLADGFQRLAADAAIDLAPDDEPEQPEHQRYEIEVNLLGELQRVPGMADRLLRKAERAAGDVARRDQRQQHDLAQRQCHQ